MVCLRRAGHPDGNSGARKMNRPAGPGKLVITIPFVEAGFRLPQHDVNPEKKNKDAVASCNHCDEPDAKPEDPRAHKASYREPL